MRIAMFSWESLYSVAVGGVANHVSELAQCLAQKGHVVHVFARRAHDSKDHVIHAGVHYHMVGYDDHPDFVTQMDNMCNAFVWHLMEVERQSKKPFDVVHGHDWMCVKAVVRAKNELKRKAVLTIHSTEFGRSGNRHCSSEASRRISGIEAEGAFVADKVIAVSGPLNEEVKSLFQTPDWKLHTIHNGIHCNKFRKKVDPEKVKGSLGIHPMDPTVLYAGRLCWQKGPDYLINAIPFVLRHRPDAKFVIAGDGHMRGELEQKIHSQGLGYAVKFLGAKAPSEMVDFFKVCDVVAVPSRNEPFGIVILEAWAAGKPVLATRNGGPRETVTHDRTGLFVEESAESVAWGVCRMFDDFVHTKWMGEQGKKAAEELYSWDAISGKTEEIYCELVGAESKRKPSLKQKRKVGIRSASKSRSSSKNESMALRA